MSEINVAQPALSDRGFWQVLATAVWSPQGMEGAEYKTRPELLVLGVGAHGSFEVERRVLSRITFRLSLLWCVWIAWPTCC